MNAQNVLMNQKMNGALKNMLSVGLYSVGVTAGVVGGLILVLLVA